MKQSSIVILIFVFAVIFLSLRLDFYSSSVDKIPPGQSIKAVLVNGKKVKVSLALTETERILGLSGRTSLPEDEGLLFVFNPPADVGFWMKDMLFSIDIIWINEKGKVIWVEKNLSPESYPEIFSPPAPASYVLEVNAGFSDKVDLKTDDQIKFLP